jgi:hypothetical protein
VRKVDTDKWNTSYLSTKNTAFSIEEALPVIEQLSYVPQAIILHVLTNDIIKYTVGFFLFTSVKLPDSRRLP